MVVIRAKAPARISFGGGGTDIAPYSTEHGGAVISTTISKYTYVTLHDKDPAEQETTIHAHDLRQVTTFPPGQFVYDGKVDLAKAVLKHFNIQQPVEIHIHSDLPPGSGMATSSSLAVALIGACAGFQGRRLSKYDAAYLAYKIEREELKQRGGYQDQFAAAFGGFNYIKFRDHVTVYPMKLSPRVRLELRYRLLLVYTGQTHLSSAIQEQTMKGYTLQKANFLDGMARLKKVAKDMRDLLSLDDLSRLNEFGQLLHEGWEAKQSLSDKISTDEVDALYMLARQQGALGGKLLGAGGGGHFLLFIDPEKRATLVEKMESFGGQVVPFEFESKGLQVWSV
jgi:D-glycero-alpha-D-manno-heptose-7-phosphate kinase